MNHEPTETGTESMEKIRSLQFEDLQLADAKGFGVLTLAVALAAAVLTVFDHPAPDKQPLAVTVEKTNSLAITITFTNTTTASSAVLAAPGLSPPVAAKKPACFLSSLEPAKWLLLGGYLATLGAVYCALRAIWPRGAIEGDLDPVTVSFEPSEFAKPLKESAHKKNLLLSIGIAAHGSAEEYLKELTGKSADDMRQIWAMEIMRLARLVFVKHRWVLFGCRFICAEMFLFLLAFMHKLFSE